MTDWLQHCRVASSPADGNITLSSPPTSIDGIALSSLSASDRVLLTQQTTTPSQNTTYTYGGGVLTATADLLAPRVTVQVAPGGTYNANTVWALNDIANYQWTRQIPRVNVRDFNALGDGTDDYTAITNAMNSLPASGGTLLFPAGKSRSSQTPYGYAIKSSNLLIPSNVHVDFEEGAIIAPSMGKTVTIQGRITAHPTQQIFGGTGTLTGVSHVGTGGGTVSLSGTPSPTGSYSFAILIITSGSSPSFQYSLNYSASGGTVWSTSKSFSSPYLIPNTGVTITFSGSFTATDIYTWSSGPPVLVNSNGQYAGTDRFPVKWWGALGNGSNDDSGPISNAAQSIFLGTGNPTSGTLIFAPGVYLVSESFTIPYFGTPPVGIRLVFEEGASLSASSASVTIQGPVTASHIARIFVGSGYNGSIIQNGPGPGITLSSGTPLGLFPIQITINPADHTQFTYTINGVIIAQPLYFPVSVPYTIPGTGVTVTFSGTYTAGTTYTWTAYPAVQVTKLVSDQFPLRWWGAAGDNTTDDSQAIQTALNAVSIGAQGGTIQVPAGTYLCGSGTALAITSYNSPIALTGPVGRYHSPAIFTYPNNTGNLLQLASANNVEIRHLTLQYTIANFGNDLVKCMFDVTKGDPAYITFDSVVFQGTGGPAINASSLLNLLDALDVTVRDCVFLYAVDGIQGSGSTPVSVQTCTFSPGATLSGYAIHNPQQGWSIRDCTFEGGVGGKACGIYSDPSTLVSAFALVIEGNWFGDVSSAGAGSNWITLLADGASITGNYFVITGSSPTVGDSAIVLLANCQGIQIAGNFFDSLPAIWATAITINPPLETGSGSQVLPTVGVNITANVFALSPGVAISAQASPTSPTFRYPTSGIAVSGNSYSLGTINVGLQYVDALSMSGNSGPVVFEAPLIPGCVLWLRADRGTTVLTGVSAWNDQSGTGDAYKHVRQATGSAQPTLNMSNASFNNQPTIEFNGSQYLQSGTWVTALTQPFTIFAVAKLTSGASLVRIILDNLAGTCQMDENSGIWQTYAGTVLPDTTSVSVLNATAFGAIYNTTSSSLWLNKGSSASDTGNAGTNGITGTTIGTYSVSPGTDSWVGSIAEIVIYARALSNTEMLRVMTYLGTRYGITIL